MNFLCTVLIFFYKYISNPAMNHWSVLPAFSYQRLPHSVYLSLRYKKPDKWQIYHLPPYPAYHFFETPNVYFYFVVSSIYKVITFYIFCTIILTLYDHQIFHRLHLIKIQAPPCHGRRELLLRHAPLLSLIFP